MVFSVVFIIIIVSFLAIIENYANENSILFNSLKNYLGLLCILGFIGFFIANLSNIFPFTNEKLNSKISGNLILNLEDISINSRILKFKDILKLHIIVNNYKGLHENFSLNSSSLTPYYKIGKNNFIEILTKTNEEIRAEFLVNSKNDIQLLNDYFAKTVIDNRINLDLNKLYNLPENIKNTQYFKNFVADLLIKKEIECGYGILLIGYDSDKEAKLLREKYCT